MRWLWLQKGLEHMFPQQTWALPWKKFIAPHGSYPFPWVKFNAPWGS